MFTMSPLFVSMGAAAGGGGGPNPFVQSSGLINDSGHASTGYTWGTKPTLNNWVWSRRSDGAAAAALP